MHLQTVDPTVLAGSDVGWGALTLVVAALHVFALLAAGMSVLRSPRLAPAGRLLWLAVLLLMPFVGAIAWFLWGRHARLDRVVR